MHTLPSIPRRFRPALLALALLALPALAPARADDSRDALRNAVVKIFPISNAPDYWNPWSMRGPVAGTGTGSVISGRRILTNAHVVGNQTFIQVRRNGDPRRYQARVLFVSHEADLALLTVDDETFFDGIEPLDFGDLPEAQDEVLVYGFPLGGDSLSITRGVISRIEHQTYIHSGIPFLAGQIDAAINPGNSGGPVIQDGRIVGVVMQGIPQADNIGYMVPVPIIRHFFANIADGVYQGFPSLGVNLQNIENPDLMSRFGMADGMSGVLVNRIAPGAPADGILERGDVILAIDGFDVAGDGTIEFRPRQRTSLSYAIQRRQLGEDLSLHILRHGEHKTLTVNLHRPQWHDWLVPLDQYDVLPTYYIFAGAIFVPLTKNMLKAWGGNWARTAPLELVHYLHRNIPSREGEQVVLILKFLPDDVNQGYHNAAYWVVEDVNGQPIHHMNDLVNAIETSDAPFIELTSVNGAIMVFDRERALAAHARILQTYRIPADRSDDLPPPPAPTLAPQPDPASDTHNL